jgi:hypothetical protein
MKVPASAIALSHWISAKALTVRMSVQGQKHRFDGRLVTSGLPPTSDMSLHRTK